MWAVWNKCVDATIYLFFLYKIVAYLICVITTKIWLWLMKICKVGFFLNNQERSVERVSYHPTSFCNGSVKSNEAQHDLVDHSQRAK